MKERFFAVIVGIVLACGIVGFVDANAQSVQPDSIKKDSIIVNSNSPNAQPIFSGDEVTKTDSLVSVAQALNDSTLKHLVSTTIDEIQHKPVEGSPWSAYAGWVIGIAFAGYEVFIYIRKRFKPKST